MKLITKIFCKLRNVREQSRPLKTIPVEKVVTIPFNRLVICGSCRAGSNAYIGDACPACGEVGNLLSFARWANANPELGQITYVFKPKMEAAHA